MAAKTKGKASYAVEIIAHLARRAYADDHVSGLTGAQQTALRFFGKASKFSLTLSAFADYHATTLGSASQTVNGLVKKGFLRRVPSEQDRRSARFDVTEKGRCLCYGNPFGDLVRVIAALPENSQANLAAILENVLACFGGDPQGQYLGICATCQFLKESVDQKNAATVYVCVRTGGKVSGHELQDICMNYRPRMPALG